MTLYLLHQKYIQGSLKKAIVADEEILLCYLSKQIRTICQLRESKVYINTRVLKHMYDKRSAAHYFIILKYLKKIIEKPDLIYTNKSGKRGNLGFCKEIEGSILFCSLETKNDQLGSEVLCVVTAFETDENYLKKCTLIWNRRDGISSS